MILFYFRSKEKDQTKYMEQHDRDIVQNYTKVKQLGKGRQRLLSKIVPVRDYNNWAKAALIRYAYDLHESAKKRECRDYSHDMSVLDLGCGKGGDLGKFAKLPHIRYYTGIDLTLASLVEAIRRYNDQLERQEDQIGAHERSGQRSASRGHHRPLQFVADFVWANLTVTPVHRYFNRGKFDVVSCMFMLHYAFQSQERARCLFANIKQLLNKSGFFIAIFPCKQTILQRLKNNGWGQGNTPKVLKNNIYKLEFLDEPQNKMLEDNAYGQGYRFTLIEAVDDTIEYLIDSQALLQLCEEQKLKIVDRIPNIEQVFTHQHIDKVGDIKKSFKSMMKNTSYFMHTLQKVMKRQNITNQNDWGNNDQFWDQFEKENDDTNQANQGEHMWDEKQSIMKPIQHVNEINEEYLEVIRLYEAVIIQHLDSDSVKYDPITLAANLVKKRKACDICNLMGESIDYNELRQQVEPRNFNESVIYDLNPE